MTKVLAYPGDDGVAVIVAPVRWEVAEIDAETGAETVRPETDDEMLARVAEADVPKGAEAVTVGAADLPADRVLRPAWRIAGGAVVEDRDAAAAFAEGLGLTVDPADDVPTIRAKVRGRGA